VHFQMKCGACILSWHDESGPVVTFKGSWFVTQRSLLVHAGYAAQGDFENMVTYSTANGYKPDYLYLMQRMMMDNPEAAVNLAKMVAKQPGPPIDLNTMTDLFLQVASRCYRCQPSILTAAADKDEVKSQLILGCCWTAAQRCAGGDSVPAGRPAGRQA
jgi:hypothetical protein